jgi:septal ring factor EnvC (AmiA/AmiB activator)
MSRIDPSNEPARQPDYQRMYKQVRKLQDRIQTQDECITWLLVELRAAQKRLTKLEQHNADTTAKMARLAMVKMAHERLDELRELEQRGDLPDRKDGHPPA